MQWVDMTNRFKGLDLVERMSENLWMEILKIAQGVVTKTIPQKKKYKKATWLFKEALQITEERKEVKNKGKWEINIQLKKDFQRRTRREKKAFFNKQCKEIEENNRMGKTRNISKKIRDIKGNFPAKMGMIKGRNSKELTEAEEIKKRWQEYTEELYKKSLNDTDNHNGMLTHIEQDILECEVKWALGSINTNKASGGNEILAELFKILKYDIVKVLYSIYQQIWKPQQWTQD